MIAASIRRAVGDCLKGVDLRARLRLLGVRAGTLQKAGSAARSARVKRPRRAAAEPHDSAELPFGVD